MVASIDPSAVLSGGWGEVIGRDELESLKAPHTRSHKPQHPLDTTRQVEMYAAAHGAELSDVVYIANQQRTSFLQVRGLQLANVTDSLGGLPIVRRLVSGDFWAKQKRQFTAAGVEFGMCANGMNWGAEMSYSTKQTGGMADRIQAMMWGFFAGLRVQIAHEAVVYDHYTEVGISNGQAHDTFCKFILAGLGNPAAISEYLGHWHTPEHAEQKPRNAASLLQAYSARGRGRALWGRAADDVKALDIVDTVAGVSRPVLDIDLYRAN